MIMTPREGISNRRLREPLKPFCRITSVSAVIHDYIRYGLYGLYYDVLMAIVSCHDLRRPNHFVCYIIIRQQAQRRPVSLVVFWLSQYKIPGQIIRYIFSGRILIVLKIGYWIIRGVLEISLSIIIVSLFNDAKRDLRPLNSNIYALKILVIISDATCFHLTPVLKCPEEK